MVVTNLLIEPRLYFVSFVFGTDHSLLAMPYDLKNTGLPLWAKSTVPEKRSRATSASRYAPSAAARASSEVDAGACSFCQSRVAFSSPSPARMVTRCCARTDVVRKRMANRFFMVAKLRGGG